MPELVSFPPREFSSSTAKTIEHGRRYCDHRGRVDDSENRATPFKLTDPDDSNVEHMRRALRLAKRGWQYVSPNPLVGAVIVRRNRVVGEGYHRRFGGPHAEVAALRRAGSRARGADLYVSLEPCAHHGKTPPCSDSIVEAGLRRVYYASKDPNPETRGRGPRLLRRRGIEVHAGLLEADALDLNAHYFHWRLTKLPWVVLKWAMTADGKIASRSGDARWISGEASRKYAHALRRRVDAVIVGTGTYRLDDPHLLPRPERGRFPLRVILDRKGRLPLQQQIFASGEGPRLYVTGKGTSATRCRKIEHLGIEVLHLPEKSGLLNMRSLLSHLGQRDVSQVLVEGGQALHGSLIDARLAQEAVVFMAPKILGGETAPGPVGGRGFGTVRQSWPFRETRVRKLGDDVVMEGRIQ